MVWCKKKAPNATEKCILVLYFDLSHNSIAILFLSCTFLAFYVMLMQYQQTSLFIVLNHLKEKAVKQPPPPSCRDAPVKRPFYRDTQVVVFARLPQPRESPQSNWGLGFCCRTCRLLQHRVLVTQIYFMTLISYKPMQVCTCSSSYLLSFQQEGSQAVFQLQKQVSI